MINNFMYQKNVGDYQPVPSQSNAIKANHGSLMVVVLLLIVIGVGSRLWLVDWPNFKPTLAIALFLGFLTNRTSVAMAAIVGMMLVSDFLIGFYELPLMLAVYGGLSLAGWIGCRVRGLLLNRTAIAYRMTTVGLSAAVGSVVYFLITNTAVWAFGWYQPGWVGLWQAWVAGIPFFKFTLAGDLLFSLTLFAVYFAWSHYLTMSATNRVAMSRINCKD